MSDLVKNILMWVFIAGTLFTVFNNFSSENKSEVVSYSDFLSQVESDQVLSVQFLNDNYTIKGKTVNGDRFETVKPQGAFYVFPKSPDPDDVAFVKRAQQENILLVPGSGFGGPGHFRISLCCDPDTIDNSRPGFERLAGFYGLY